MSEQEIFSVIRIRPPGLAKNKLLKVAEGLRGIGRQSGEPSHLNASLRPDVDTIYNEDEEIINTGSKWIKAGFVTEEEQDFNYITQIIVGLLDISIETLRGILDYEVKSIIEIDEMLREFPKDWSERT